MGFSIEFSGTTSTMCHKFEEPVRLDPNKKWEICLTSFVTYNSINNVTEKNNEFDFVDDKGNVDRVTIPVGTYEVEDILKYIEEHKNPNIDFEYKIFHKTRKIRLICKKHKIALNTPYSVGILLGFSRRVIPVEYPGDSDKMVDIFPVNMIRIRCNLIDSNYENGKSRGNIIYSFPLKALTGEKIVKEPSQHKYYPVNTNLIRDVYIQIVDQDNRLIDFNGETITLDLHVRLI